MTWTYGGDPSASELDAVRFLIGDTIEDEPHLSDEEIAWTLTEWMPVHGDIYLVAAECAEQVSVKYAREVTATGDGMSVDMAALQAKFADAALSLRHRAMERRGGALPEAGGMDLFERVDFTIKPFHFGMGVHDNDRAGQQNYGGVNPVGVELDTSASGP